MKTPDFNIRPTMEEVHEQVKELLEEHKKEKMKTVYMPDVNALFNDEEEPKKGKKGSKAPEKRVLSKTNIEKLKKAWEKCDQFFGSSYSVVELDEHEVISEKIVEKPR